LKENEKKPNVNIPNNNGVLKGLDENKKFTPPKDEKTKTMNVN